MRLFIFPRGLTYSAPADRLGRKVADLVSNPTEARERLCGGVYRAVEPTNHLGLVQEAMLLTVAAEPLLKRIRVEGAKTGRVTALDLPGQIGEAEAGGIISAEEAAQLREYDRKVMEIIHVDDFDAAELAAGAAATSKPTFKAQVA
jgi:acyl-CoA dehydrogenase